MSSQSEYDELYTLAEAISPHLPGWTLEPRHTNAHEYPPRWVYLARQDGAAIGLALDRHGREPRLDVSGRYPTDITVYRDHRPSITLSRLRPPDALAREILRRFVPAYLAAWDEAEVALMRLRQSQGRVQYAAETVASVTGLSLGQIRYDCEKTHATLYTAAGVVTVSYDGKLSLATHALDGALALDVLTRLMDATAQGPEATLK